MEFGIKHTGDRPYECLDTCYNLGVVVFALKEFALKEFALKI
jgi:hypothetical protein